MNKHWTMIIAALGIIGVILWFLSIRLMPLVLLWLLIGVPRQVAIYEMYEKEKDVAMLELSRVTGDTRHALREAPAER